MKKLIPFALAFLSVAAIPGVSMALDTRHTFDVTESTRNGREVDVGSIRFTLIDTLEREDMDGRSLPVCRYAGSWTNNAQSPSRTNLFIDEVATLGYADCESNAHDSFDTIVVLVEDERSHGFDPQQQRRIVDKLFLREDEDGTLEGAIEFTNGNRYRITMER